MHLCSISNAAKQAHLKGQTYERSRQAKVRHGLLVVIPFGEGTKRTTLVCAEEGHTVDIASVDPAETTGMSANQIQSRVELWMTYPSRGTPLKSLPWLPYSASTLWGSICLVTSYFSTTTPLKSTKAFVTMYNHL